MKGCCDVNNLYCGFFKTEERYPYLIRLTNYTMTSDIYLSSKEEMDSFASLIKTYVIQINF